jgi:hypothetical protein
VRSIALARPYFCDVSAFSRRGGERASSCATGQEHGRGAQCHAGEETATAARECAQITISEKAHALVILGRRRYVRSRLCPEIITTAFRFYFHHSE